MIGPDEKLMTLEQAAAHVARRTGIPPDKRPGNTAVWRWCRTGIGGVKCEFVFVGRRIFTSAEALNRFFHALAEARTVPTSDLSRWANRPGTLRRRSARRRERDIAAAEKTLDDAGI